MRELRRRSQADRSAVETPSTGTHHSCPYEFEITKDGRMIVEGEDFGDAEQFFVEGTKLRDIVHLWHDVAHS